MLLHTSKNAAKSAIDTDSPDIHIHQVATDHTCECSNDKYGNDKYSADAHKTCANKPQ